MNQIQFKNIIIEGFRSIVQPLDFNLDRAGLNLIKGINGAGKTTVFEALIWCLYGVNLKDTPQDMIASWPEIRPMSWKGTRVILNIHMWGSDFQIVRHLDYKGETGGIKGGDTLMVFQDGELQGSDRNKVEAQQSINGVIGMEVKTFMNSILFGQRIAKLIEQDNTDKRKLFEQLFDVEWVNLAKAKADSILTIITSESSRKEDEIIYNETLIQEKQSKLNSIKLMLAGWENVRKDRLYAKQNYFEQRKKELKTLESNRKFVQEEIKTIGYNQLEDERLSKEFKEIDYQVKLVQTEESNRSHAISMAKQSVKSLGERLTQEMNKLDRLQSKNIESVCPYCEQELKTGNKLERNHQNEIKEQEKAVSTTKQMMKEAETELDKAINIPVPVPSADLSTRKYELEKVIATMDQKYEDYNKKERQINALDASISQVLNEIKHIEHEIEMIEKETPPPNNTMEIEEEIDGLKIDIACLREDLWVKQLEKEKCEWWSKKAFGAGGIKAFVFKAMLSQLNQNTKKYGQRLGVSMEFSIDLSKASKPFVTKCSLGDKLNKDYREFSGGQKQRLDIVLLFAMHDLISSNSDINVLIMDEVLEGLDEAGEAAVFDLIRTKADEGRSVYVISHSAVLDSLYANTIQFENVNGNTKVIK